MMGIHFGIRSAAASMTGMLSVILAAVVVIGTAIVFATLARAETCRASWYGHGRSSPACRAMTVGPITAAHLTLPCGTQVRVTTARGSAVLTVTDRGPFIRGRCIDVSKDAAGPLGLIDAGVLPATVEVLGP